MAKFIKFTNVQPKDLFGNNGPAIEELIVSTDRISSISKTGDRFSLSVKTVIVERLDEGRHKITPDSQSAIISKEDYENAKKILLEV